MSFLFYLPASEPFGKVRKEWKSQVALLLYVQSLWCSLMSLHAGWWLEQKLCINNMLPSTAQAKPICLLNGQSCPGINTSWADSREWSPLQDLLYSQPQLLPAASGQQSDGWRDGGAVGRGGGERESVAGWKVKLGDKETTSGERKENEDGVIIELLILDAGVTFDLTRLQVSKKQTKSLSKHMDWIYLLPVSTAHRCRLACRCWCP